MYGLALLLGAWVISRANFTADMSAFLPSAPTASQRLLIDQLKHGVASRSLMVGIAGGDAAMRAKASRELAARLRGNVTFTSVNNGERVDYAAVGERLMAHRYLLSDAVLPDHFRSVDGLRAALQDTALRLATPEGAAFKPLWPRDPTGEMLRVAEGLLPAQSPAMDQGVWVSRDGQRAVLLLTLAASVDDIDAQARSTDMVRQTFRALALPALTLQLSGAGVFAEQSRTLIEGEVHRLSTMGIIGVGLMLWLAFGRVMGVALAALPVLSGVVAGIAAVALGFGQVHGMTLGFGAALVGEAVDYGIYYLIQARGGAGEPAQERWWRHGWPTVRLGVMTSVCGFGALVFSGFPGLAQLGVFSIAGLVVAALVTRHVLPVLAPQGAAGAGLRHSIGRFAARAFAGMPRLRLPLLALTALALVAMALAPGKIWRGDLQSLSPLPREALQVDAILREDLGASDARTLVVAQGPTQDAALASAELAARRLDALVADGVLTGYESPTRLLPSQATQTARRDALPAREQLAPLLEEAVQGLPFRATQLEAFLDDVQAARSPSSTVDRSTYAGTPLATVLDAQLLRRDDGSWAALLPLHWAQPTASDAAERLAAAVASVPSAMVLDVKDSLDALYDHYLREALWQSVLGALAVMALLAVVLRNVRRLAAVALPLAAAVVLVLAALAWAGVAMGILHLIGLLLTVAVGSNYALYFDQLAHTQATGNDDTAAQTMASLVFANLTTVLTFGLLATSHIAALAAIGMAVAPGALLSLLLSAALIKPRAASTPTPVGNGRKGNTPV